MIERTGEPRASVAVVSKQIVGSASGRLASAADKSTSVVAPIASTSVVRYYIVSVGGGTWPVLPGRRLLIGTGGDCDLILLDQHAGLRHAEVIMKGNDLIVHDLCSASGTTVNGVSVIGGGAVLGHNDIITIAGRTDVMVVDRRVTGLQHTA